MNYGTDKAKVCLHSCERGPEYFRSCEAWSSVLGKTGSHDCGLLGGTRPIAAIPSDEMAIGVGNHKTTGVRLIPVPGKKVGEKAVFGGLFGEATIAEVRGVNRSSKFVGFGGRIPAPITSINN